MKIKIRNQIYKGANNKNGLYDLTIPDNHNGKVVVFLHGFMGFKDWGAWHLVEEYFLNSNFGFLKYNISHGGTTIENAIEFVDLNAFSSNTYTLELEDLNAVLNQLSIDFNEEPEVFLIGHSRGGGIALLGIEDVRVKKIATWAAISNIEERFPLAQELIDWKVNGVRYIQNARTGQKMPMSYNLFEDFIQNKDRLNIEARCSHNQKPVLVVHGEKDLAVPIDEGRALSQWLGGQLQIIEGGDHTFGSKHPWIDPILPEQLLNVCQKTAIFFKQ